jgi:hypothetical protein
MGIIVPNLLVAHDALDAAGNSTKGDTPSYNPAANQTVILIANGLNNPVTPPPAVPTVVGNGLSWSLVASITYDHAGADRGGLFVFRGLSATPTVGTTRVQFNSLFLRMSISVVQYSNTALGNLGADAIVGTPAKVEIAASSGPNPGLGAPAGEDPANSQIGVLGYSNPNAAFTPGIGFSSITNVPTAEAGDTGGGGHGIEFSQNVRTLVDFNVLSQPTFVIVAIELRNALAAAAAAGPQIQGRPSFVGGNLITP